jgi:hypothetical protein
VFGSLLMALHAETLARFYRKFFDFDFGPGFVALARAVYVTNDRRAALKRQINALSGSELVEEKSYTAY